MSAFNISAVARFSSEDVAFMSTSQLSQFISFVPGVSTPSDSEVLSFIRARNLLNGLNFNERILLRENLTVTPKTRERSIRPDEFTKDTAITVVYLPKELVVQDIPEARLNNTIVPTEKPQRRGSSSLIAFFGMMLDVSSSRWVVRGNATDFQKVFKEGIDIHVSRALAAEVANALNNDSVFSSIPQVKKSAISKDVQARFLMEYFNRMSLADYLVLHCTIVYNCFTIYAKMGLGKGYRARDEKLRDKGPDFFSKTDAIEMFNTLSASDRKVVLDSANQAPPRLFFGRANLKVVLPQVTNILELVKVVSTRMAIASDSVVPMLLYTMKDFTGMHTKMGRRVATLCSLAMGQWKAGVPVDIHIQSSGDVSFLTHSLLWCLSNMKLTWAPVEGTFFRVILSHENFIKVREANEYLFTASRLNQKIKVGEIESTVAATQIFWSKAGLPTSAEHGKAVEWEFESSRYLSMQANARRWIYVGPIFGHYMFGQTTKVTTSTVVLPEPKHKAQAYGFGDNSNLRGVLSNVEVEFMGLAAEEKDKSFKFSPETLVVPVFVDPASWYNHVRAENGRKLSSWFAPITRYSPVSNVLRHSKKGANQAIMQELLEKGGLTEEQVAMIMSTTEVSSGPGEVYSDDAMIPQLTTDVAPLANLSTDPASSASSGAAPVESEEQGEVFS